MDPFEHYVSWCKKLGITPAPRETYEKTAHSITEVPRCECGAHVRAFGDACAQCILGGLAPHKHVIGRRPASQPVEKFIR